MTLPDFERLDVWRSFLTAHAAMSKMLSRALEEENNLQLPWFEVLDALATAEEGSLRFNELAEKVMAHPSSLSRQIDRMEEKKLVKQWPLKLPTSLRILHLANAQPLQLLNLQIWLPRFHQFQIQRSFLPLAAATVLTLR